MKTETTFGELQIGQAFHFRGVRYVKLALACAEDSRHWGHVFLVETVVETEEGQSNAEILKAESSYAEMRKFWRVQKKTGSSSQGMAERPGEFSNGSM